MVSGMMAKVLEEKLRWFQAFMRLYGKAGPVIRHITNLEKLRSGELPVGPAELVVSNLTLRPVLSALDKLQKPKDKDLSEVQKEFRLALLNSIKASELAEKYLEYESRSKDRLIVLGMIINAIVLAQEYLVSASKKLSPHLIESTLSE